MYELQEHPVLQGAKEVPQNAGYKLYNIEYRHCGASSWLKHNYRCNTDIWYKFSSNTIKEVKAELRVHTIKHKETGNPTINYEIMHNDGMHVQIFHARCAY